MLFENENMADYSLRRFENKIESKIACNQNWNFLKPHWNTDISFQLRLRGLMDKAPDFESGDYGFESRRGQTTIFTFPIETIGSF